MLGAEDFSATHLHTAQLAIAKLKPQLPHGSIPPAYPSNQALNLSAPLPLHYNPSMPDRTKSHGSILEWKKATRAGAHSGPRANAQTWPCNATQAHPPQRARTLAWGNAGRASPAPWTDRWPQPCEITSCHRRDIVHFREAPSASRIASSAPATKAIRRPGTIPW